MSMHKPLYPHHPVIMLRLEVLLRDMMWLLLEVGRWLGRVLHMWVLLMVRVLLMVVVLLLLVVMVVVRHVHNRGLRRQTMQHFPSSLVRVMWLLRMRQLGGKRGYAARTTMQVAVAQVAGMGVIFLLGLSHLQRGRIFVDSSNRPPTRGRASRPSSRDRWRWQA